MTAPNERGRFSLRTRRTMVVALLVFAALVGNLAASVPASAQLLGLFGSSSQPPPPPPPASQPAASAPADLALPAGSGEGRRVVYDNGQQHVWLVEQDGSVVGSWPVSGRIGAPRPGTYQVFSRSRTTIAKGGKAIMEYMVRFARTPGLSIGFHAIPTSRRTGAPIQSEAELGRPTSLGCVRQREADAITMWIWAQIGTTVVVV